MMPPLSPLMHLGIAMQAAFLIFTLGFLIYKGLTKTTNK